MGMGIVGLLMIALLMLGFPFVITLLAPLLAYFGVNMPNMNLQVVVQQLIRGFSPASLVAVPMFILAANIMTSGKAATRLVEMIRVFVGHIPGGLAITTNASCTLFGAVSGSTQATVSAIGGTMRPMLLKAGYSSSFTLGLIINASDIALLIPPSIGFIVYGVVTSTSIGKLFLAGNRSRSHDLHSFQHIRLLLFEDQEDCDHGESDYERKDTGFEGRISGSRFPLHSCRRYLCRYILAH